MATLGELLAQKAREGVPLKDAFRQAFDEADNIPEGMTLVEEVSLPEEETDERGYTF